MAVLCSSLFSFVSCVDAEVGISRGPGGAQDFDRPMKGLLIFADYSAAMLAAIPLWKQASGISLLRRHLMK